MLESLRRLLSKGPRSDDTADIEAWAQTHGHQFKRVRDAEGCLVEPVQPGDAGWRIEWGESQRSYFTGRELRYSAEVGTPRDLLVLVLNRELMEAMEKSVFEQYVEDVQTRMDTEAPPEMRWLVMFPKLAGTELGRLRDRYGAVSSAKPWLQLWLANGLEDALAGTLDAPQEQPVALVIARGRLTMRTPMAEPDMALLERWFDVFQRIAPVARRLARESAAAAVQRPSVWPPSGADEE